MKGFIFAILVLCSLSAHGQLLNPAFVPLIPSVQGDDMFFTTSRGRIYKIPVDSILAYIERMGDFGGVTDGDKGDISVSTGGTVWNIDAGVVGATELASTAVTPGTYTNTTVTFDAGGRATAASSGTVADASATNEGSLTVGAGAGTTSLIQSNTSGSTAVTLTAGTGLTISEAGNTITLASSLVGVTDGDKGDITVSSTGANWQIDANAVGSAEIATDAVGTDEIAANAVGASELASTTVTAGSYTATNLTVDADGRITAASNGTAGVTGSGTVDRVAYWSTSTGLGSFPLSLNGTRTEFTQSTNTKLPTGGTATRGTVVIGAVRCNSDTGEFEGSRDGSTWEQFAMGQIYADTYLGITSGTSISPNSSLFVQAVISSGSATLTIDDSGVPAGAYMDVINSGAGALVLDRVSGVFIKTDGSYSTISITDQTARFVFSGYSWYLISIQ